MGDSIVFGSYVVSTCKIPQGCQVWIEERDVKSMMMTIVAMCIQSAIQPGMLFSCPVRVLFLFSSCPTHHTVSWSFVGSDVLSYFLNKMQIPGSPEESDVCLVRKTFKSWISCSFEIDEARYGKILCALYSSFLKGMLYLRPAGFQTQEGEGLCPRREDPELDSGLEFQRGIWINKKKKEREEVRVHSNQEWEEDRREKKGKWEGIWRFTF